MMRPDYMEMLGRNLPSDNSGNSPMAPKRVGPNMPGGVNDPRSKQYNPNGSMNLEVGPGNSGGQTGGLDPVGPTGGLGGAWGKGGGPYNPMPIPEGGPYNPMPVPEFGPNRRGNPGDVNPYEFDRFMDPDFKRPGPFTGYDQNYWDKKRGNTGGFDPVGPGGGLGGPYDEDGGPQNPMPKRGINWNTVNGNTFANVNPHLGDPYAASQMVKQENMMNPAWRDTGNGNGYVDVHRRLGGHAELPQPAPAVPGNTGIVPPHMGEGANNSPRPQQTPQVSPPMGAMPAPMASAPYQRMRQMRQFQPHGFGGMNGGQVPRWQNAMGNSPQGRMDFLNKLKQSYSGGQGFKWNF